MDVDKNRRWLVERILTRGRLEDWQLLVGYLGYGALRELAPRLKLTGRERHFLDWILEAHHACYTEPGGTMTSEQELSKIRNILQTQFSFSKVILFGSQARGTAKADSDIDLCILNSGTTRKLDVSRQVRRALYAEIKSPIDVLVYNPDEFAIRARELKSIERVIAEEGIPLYG